MKVVLGELDRFSERLSVPSDVAEEAARIYKRCLKMGLASGKPPTRVAVASLYAACREKDLPRTLDDVAAVSGVRKTELAKFYRLLVNELELKIPFAGPAEYLPRVASRAQASAEVQASALEILSRAEAAGIAAGANPTGVAASALYIASAVEGEKLTQRKAAEAAGVAEATLRKEYKRLRKGL